MGRKDQDGDNQMMPIVHIMSAQAAVFDPSKPLTMLSLFPYFAGLAGATLAVGLAVAKWFLNTQVTGKIDQLSDQLEAVSRAQSDAHSELKTQIAVLTERVQNMKEAHK